MKSARIAAVMVGLWGWLLLAGAAAAQSGRLEGRLTRPDGGGLPGVRVTVVETHAATLSDSAGRFGFNLPPGTYSIELEAAGHHDTAGDLAIQAAVVTRFDRTLDWPLSAAQSVVSGVTVERVRAAEATAVVQVLAGGDLARRDASTPLPGLLALVPGLDVAQSGLYDYSVSAHGFNGVQARGVPVLIDGRDAGLPFFGGQEWSGFPLPLPALQQVEVEAGADGALYGPNATGGVISVVTRRAGDGPRLAASASAGDLSTTQGDLVLGDRFGPWAAAVTGDYRKSGDYAVSRNGHAEYSSPCTAPGQIDCLPQESVPLPRPDDDQMALGSARLDRLFGDGSFLTLGGGYLQEKGPVETTDIGRVQVLDGERKWAQVSYDALPYDLRGSYTGRAAGQQIDLATGENLALDSRTFQGQGDTSWSFQQDRVRLLGGIWYQDEQTDSEDKSGPVRPTLLLPDNQETLLFQRVRASSEAAYAQVEWNPAAALQLVAGGRYDSSALWSSQFSPRLGLSWALAPGQVVRLRYDRSFRAPTEEQLFLQHDVAAPVNLSSLENICTLEGVPCGFDLNFHPGSAPGPGIAATRVLAVGNSNLEPEHVTSYEAGYTGVFGPHVLITLDVYRSQHTDVITDLLPQLGTSLGRVNSQFGPYVYSPFLSAAAQAQLAAGLQSLLGPLRPYLTTNVDGTPILAMESYTNYGAVDAWGGDFGLRLTLAAGLIAGLNYSYFDGTPRDAAPDLAYLLSANTPRHRAGASLGWSGGPVDVAADYRWVDSFFWVSGPFAGTVPSYGLVDLAGKIHLGPHWALGVDVANLLDKKHFETFGGDILRRRALGSVSVEW